MTLRPGLRHRRIYFFHIQPFPFRPHRRGVRYVGAGFHCAAALSDAAVSQAHVGKAPVRLFSGGVHLCHHQGRDDAVCHHGDLRRCDRLRPGRRKPGEQPPGRPFSALSWGCEHCDLHCDEEVQQKRALPHHYHRASGLEAGHPLQPGDVPRVPSVPHAGAHPTGRSLPLF